MSDHYKAVSRVLWVVLGLNLTIAGAKISTGIGIDSLAMIADGFHSLLDGSSNIVGLVGIYLASRPPDLDHPYGHQKYEAFSALGIALLLGVTALEVVRLGIGRLSVGGYPTPTWFSIAVMLVTMVVNVFISRYEASQGKRLKSQILLADSAHTRSDVLVSASVIVGLIAVWVGVLWLDAVVAFVIAGVILWIAYGVLKKVTSVLTDSTGLLPQKIREEVLAVPEVISCSQIRSRGEPPHLFIDLEIQLNPDLPLWRAHRISHAVMDRVRDAFAASDVVVHAEPTLEPPERSNKDPHAPTDPPS